jgi:hypothetical protein
MTMASDRPEFPRPEAIWIALGIVVWAIAEALEDGRGRRFLDALERRTAEQAGALRVVPFGPPSPDDRTLGAASRLAAAWLRRLAAELRNAMK